MSIMHFSSTVISGGGGVVCTPGTSAITNINDTSTSPDPAQAGAKWDSDGDVYTRIGTGSWGTADSTWIDNCANSGYEGRWVLSLGDAPTQQSGSDGVWHSMVTSVRVGYDTQTAESLGGDFIFELRRSSDQVVILTDSFSLDVTESI